MNDSHKPLISSRGPAIIVVVIVNYHQLVGRYPQGGGAAAAAGEAFGEPSAFIPIAALIVDFVLTIAISTAAAASAIIAFFPSLAGLRAPIALLLVAGVAAGHCQLEQFEGDFRPFACAIDQVACDI